jgi:CheY-like chemotaxis protein
MSARVLIVDDDVDSCWLVALVLRRDPNLALAGEATDGEMAVPLVRQERPDVVVMDVMMPRLDGLEATRRSRARRRLRNRPQPQHNRARRRSS